MLRQFGRFSDTAGLKEVFAVPYVSVSELNLPALVVFSPKHSFYSRFIVWSKGCIKSVIASGDIAEVSKPIVGLDSVDMVDMKFRPLTSHIEPSKAMFFVHLAKAYVSVASTKGSSTFAGRTTGKYSSLRVVIKQSFEAFQIHFATPNSELIGGGSYNCHTPHYTKINTKRAKLC